MSMMNVLCLSGGEHFGHDWVPQEALDRGEDQRSMTGADFGKRCNANNVRRNRRCGGRLAGANLHSSIQLSDAKLACWQWISAVVAETRILTSR
jgi:hypothetical protein